MSTNPPGREATERRSAVPLAYLRQLPPWTIPVLSAVLLVAGLAIKGPAVPPRSPCCWSSSAGWPTCPGPGWTRRAGCCG